MSQMHIFPWRRCFRWCWWWKWWCRVQMLLLQRELIPPIMRDDTFVRLSGWICLFPALFSITLMYYSRLGYSPPLINSPPTPTDATKDDLFAIWRLHQSLWELEALSSFPLQSACLVMNSLYSHYVWKNNPKSVDSRYVQIFYTPIIHLDGYCP